VVSTHDELPKDTESLHRLLIDARQSIAQRDEQLRLAEASTKASEGSTSVKLVAKERCVPLQSK
jgi:hypothetical protein